MSVPRRLLQLSFRAFRKIKVLTGNKPTSKKGPSNIKRAFRAVRVTAHNLPIPQLAFQLLFCACNHELLLLVKKINAAQFIEGGSLIGQYKWSLPSIALSIACLWPPPNCPLPRNYQGTSEQRKPKCGKCAVVALISNKCTCTRFRCAASA